MLSDETPKKTNRSLLYDLIDENKETAALKRKFAAEKKQMKNGSAPLEDAASTTKTIAMTSNNSNHEAAPEPVAAVKESEVSKKPAKKKATVTKKVKNKRKASMEAFNETPKKKAKPDTSTGKKASPVIRRSKRRAVAKAASRY